LALRLSFFVLELFKPFIFNKLEMQGIATTIKAAKREVEAETPWCGTFWKT